jgi:predicted TIM-barrel fold metal-dependent hydrolase
MRLPLPGPAALIGGAAAAADAVETAIGLVPRAAAAMTRVEALLDRVEVVVDRAEIVTRDASRAADGAQGVLDRVDASLVAWEPSLRRLAPSMVRFADALAPDELTAAITLVDRMPVVLDHLENDVLPMLRGLDRVGPDIHELLAVVEDLRQVVTGLPGIDFLRKRGDDDPPPTA